MASSDVCIFRSILNFELSDGLKNEMLIQPCPGDVREMRLHGSPIITLPKLANSLYYYTNSKKEKS
jgi:hypothetical protein